MENNRRNFLKLTGLASAASLIPLNVFSKQTETEQQLASCVLIPTETAGPFPLDLTANTTFFRKDVRENKTGAPLNLKLKIIGANNCGAMQNVRVNIWHCDKDGLYSGYSQSNNPGQAGLTYLRGYQFTDANGLAEFTTIFPGWYSGRICHIHFQVYVSSSYAAISQLSFDITKKQAIYAANATLYTKGDDPTTLSGDNIFSDGYTYQIATLTDNTATGGYDAYLEVTIKGSGIATGLGNLEKENTKNFTLGQNFPNPYSAVTSIPVHLIQQSDVVIDLYDLQGKKMTTISKTNLPAGEAIFQVDMKALGLPVANYIYQVEVKNSNGIYRDCKMMTVLQ
jgi:protocatechuate 3,4-dioxygenase beta subunit